MRNVILFLSVIALSYANTCFFNGTDVATTCVAVNPACSWTNANLWTNCGNGTSPGTTDTAYVISGNTSFTLVIDTPASIMSIIMQGPGNLATLFVNNTLAVAGVVDINNGIFQINDDVTISANATLSVGTGASIQWTSGDINWAAGSAGMISVEAGATLSLSAGAKATNQDILNQGTVNFATTATLTLNAGADINSNGTININGNVNIAGTTGSSLFSDVNGNVVIVPSTSTEVVTLSLPAKIKSALSVANTTLTVQNAFFVQNLTVEAGAVLNIAIADGSVPAFAVYNFQNDGTVSWTNGELFQVTTNSGIFTNNGAFSINLGANSTATLACNQTTMENFGTFTVSSASEIDGNFMSGNNGVVVINAYTSFFGYNHTFSEVTFDGVSVSGTGNALFKSDVYFFAGTYAIQSTILGTFNIAHNDTKTLSYNVNATHMNISAPVELTVAFTNNAYNYINGDGGVFLPVGNDSATYPTFVNNGFIYGSLTFDRINLTNNAVIGSDDTATVLKMVDSYLELANTSNLVLGLYDQTVSPIQVSKSNRNMGGNPGAYLNGSLLIVLLEGFHPQNGNMTIFSSYGQAPITGNFTSANITAVENANEYNCDYNNTAINYATTEIVLEFQNCEELPETSSGPSKTTIIIIVVVVVAVVLIAAIVGVVLYRRRNAAHHPSEKQRLI